MDTVSHAVLNLSFIPKNIEGEKDIRGQLIDISYLAGDRWPVFKTELNILSTVPVVLAFEGLLELIKGISVIETP